MALIQIKNLKTKALIGINEWEKKKAQKIIINLSFSYDSKIPETTDNIDDAIDYYTIKQKILQTATSSSFNLLERLANEILQLLLQTDKRITNASVEIDKPAALEEAESVSVKIYT
ncbi:MAG: dihydroneopterin aldolase [Verrucomicrobiota bacterium]|nr:dihydroneopterin aldolase [Verrucomicrobiota bacterium]